MQIGSIAPIAPIAGTAVATVAGAGSAAGGAGFGRVLTDALSTLAQTERASGELAMRAAAGDNVDIHDVMIAAQAESLAFQVGVQVRNKAVEAYQEIFRIQM